MISGMFCYHRTNAESIGKVVVNIATRNGVFPVAYNNTTDANGISHFISRIIIHRL